MPEDQTQRDAQFMGRDGNEIGFHPVQFQQLTVGILGFIQQVLILDDNRRLGSQGLKDIDIFLGVICMAEFVD